MQLQLQGNSLSDYLAESIVINYGHPDIQRVAQSLKKKCNGTLSYIESCFEFVRDQINHSADYDIDFVTCKASDVLEQGHGICYAKSHLLASLLRANGIPSGLCYQRLILDDNEPNRFCLHGLNGVFIESEQKWFRLDPRGNKPGVNARFSIESEQPAFPVRTDLGEFDYSTIYIRPLPEIVDVLNRFSSRAILWKHLPETIQAH